MARIREGLSLAQLRLLKTMREFQPKHGFYANVRDLQKAMGHASPSTTWQMCSLLEKKGRVERVRLTRTCFVFLPVER